MISSGRSQPIPHSECPKGKGDRKVREDDVRIGELVKLVGTIAAMMAVLAVSAAAQQSIEAVEAPGTAEVTYEVSGTC